MQKIWYQCNGEDPECKKNHCYKKGYKDGCRHTSKIEYAESFEKKEKPSGSVYREKPRLQNHGFTEIKE